MLRTKLVKQGDMYVLTGKKYYATGAVFSDYTSFTALDEEGRLTASGGVDLDDVAVFPHEITSRLDGDPFVRRHNATRAQLHLVACIAGIVRNVFSDAVNYAQKQARSAKHSHSETARGDHFVQQVIGDILG
jgi:alkylation response protein AidB-like acyl-CoA dehydrogenase